MTGKELKQIREAAGMSATDLAAKVGVTAQTVINWESSPRLRRVAENALKGALPELVIPKARRTA